MDASTGSAGKATDVEREASHRLTIFELEEVAPDSFRGPNWNIGWPRVFGGQVMAQALYAAAKTVAPGRPPHSLHLYFILTGDADFPYISYDVERIRDGGSFSTRRVLAKQGERAIFSMAASFQAVEEGFEHQVAMPDVPPPEGLLGGNEAKERYLDNAPEGTRHYWNQEPLIEFRPVEFPARSDTHEVPPPQHIWVKPQTTLPDDPLLHQAVLAYASDITLLDTALITHGRSMLDPDFLGASLDHAMWFHRPFSFNDWVLFTHSSPNASGGRGLSWGNFFTRDGTLVASTAQEGLLRVKARK